jgi:hypothetical protein
MHEAHFGKSPVEVGVPPPLGPIEIMELAGNLEIIYGAQSLAGKIFRNKELADVR